jgi:hypothetical protein
MLTTNSLIVQIARTLEAHANCVKNNNTEWKIRWEEKLVELEGKLPHGSGVDNGVEIDMSSTADKIVLTVSFHHMDENGFYDGWTDHKAIVRPSFGGINIKITGKNRNEIKEYLADLFHHVLTSEPMA